MSGFPIGAMVETKDGKGMVSSRSKRKGKLELLVKLANGALYPYRADDVTRVLKSL